MNTCTVNLKQHIKINADLVVEYEIETIYDDRQISRNKILRVIDEQIKEWQ